ncbi:MAG: hypothetical protein ACK4TO_03790 [Candidatus Nitrosotenuis sp.]
MRFDKIKISIAAIVLCGAFSIGIISTTASAQIDSQESHMETTVVRDSVTVLLGSRTIQSDDYIHLYDSTPYMIMNGHVAAKLPCDTNSETPLHIMIGVAPDLRAAELELIDELSNPGKYCLYHVDLESTHNGDEQIITDVAIHNPTDRPVRTLSTSTVVIGVNEIMPMEEHGHEE